MPTSLLSLCAENWKATLEDDKRPTKRKEGRKEKLTRVHRPKNSLRCGASPRQNRCFQRSLAQNFPRRFFFLTKTHFDDVITNTLVYTWEPESDSRYAREVSWSFSFFRFSANETVKPIVPRHHLHHHRIVLGRAWLRQWDHIRLSHLLHAFQLHRRQNVQDGVRWANYRIRFKGIGWVFVRWRTKTKLRNWLNVKFFRFSSLLCTAARNEINNPDNSPFRELSFGLKE